MIDQHVTISFKSAVKKNKRSLCVIVMERKLLYDKYTHIACNLRFA